MKIKFLLVVFALFISTKFYAQSTGNASIDLILSAYSAEETFTSDPVSDEQLDLILKCGMKAPSGLNAQPWKFTVIKDEATTKAIVNDIAPGNVLIVVSGLEAEGGGTPDFDCGLATENMYIAAQALGLGARPYGSPTRIVNRMKARFQIPEGYSAVNILRIGHVDKTVDAVSEASPRKTTEEVINYFEN